jgi:DNA-binding transcriptional LysR family regulator
MELRHLRYFVAVAEAENVSRAATQLHVSQPALSRQVRDLEEELGFALLHRGAKAVRLTDAGRVFLVEARAVLCRVEEAVGSARAVASGEAGELHIGYAPTLTVRFLPVALRRFQSKWPGVRVRLHDLSTLEMLEGVREGRLHLAFTVRPGVAALRGLEFRELVEERLRLAVGPDHPLAGREVVTLAEVAKESFVVYSRREYPDYHVLLESVFASVGGIAGIAEEHDGASSLVSGLTAGHGVALVPETLGCSAGPGLKFLGLDPEPLALVVGAVWDGRGMSGVAERFMDLAVPSPGEGR